MSSALAVIEPTSPLAIRSPQRLPQWVLDIWRRVVKMTFDNVVETYIDSPPTPEQRSIIEGSRANLVRQLDLTPDRCPELNDQVLDAIGELMAAKPYRAGDGALRREALIRSFGYALDDIPYWATLRAIRNWHRGDVESWSDPKGKFNCKWMPDPTELREIAKRYVREVQDRVTMFDDILHAVERSAEASPRRLPPPPKRRDRDEGTGFRPISDAVAALIT